MSMDFHKLFHLLQIYTFYNYYCLLIYFYSILLSIDSPIKTLYFPRDFLPNFPS